MSRPVRRRPSRRLTTIAGLALALAGLAVSAGLIWNASYSAFSAQTTTPTSTWTAGTVNLTNTLTPYQGLTFNTPGVKPGSLFTQCITVTSSGTLPSVVKIYTTPNSFSTTKSMADAMTFTVQRGAGTTSSDCSGFTADPTNGSVFSGKMTDFAQLSGYTNGRGAWTTIGGSTSETQTYRFDIGFNPTAPTYTQAQIDSYQGGTAAIAVTWEAQNI